MGGQWQPYRQISDREFREFQRRFRRKARFLVDENMGQPVAQVLRSYGYSAEFVGEVGLSGRDDDEVFAYAWRKRRIILTHDRDFLDDRRFPFTRNPGVVVLPGATGDGTLEPALADLIRLFAPYGDANFGCKIEVTQDGIWHIRGHIKAEGRHVDMRVKLERRKAWSWEP